MPTRCHPVAVPAHRVDLTVVAKHPERLRQLPGGKRIRRKTLVNQRQRAGGARILKVEVVRTQCVRQHHALVADGPRGHRHDVEAVAVRSEGSHRVAELLARDKQAAFERVLVALLGEADEYLTGQRLARPDDIRQHRTVDRHVAPPEHRQAIAPKRGLGLLFAARPGHTLARKENLPDAVGTVRECEPCLRGRSAEQNIGYLHQQSDPVPDRRVGADSTPVCQVDHQFETLRDDRRTRPALEIRDKADPARIVLVRRVVQPLPNGCLGEESSMHQQSSDVNHVVPARRGPAFRASRRAALARHRHPRGANRRTGSETAGSHPERQTARANRGRQCARRRCRAKPASFAWSVPGEHHQFRGHNSKVVPLRDLGGRDDGCSLSRLPRPGAAPTHCARVIATWRGALRRAWLLVR